MTFFYVKESTIHGLGVFAQTDIPKGTLLTEYTGKHISSEEYQQLEKEGKADHIVDCEGTLIDANQGGNDARFFNHSCTPNVTYEIRDKRFFLIAKRDIQPNEELTWDYGYENELPITCHCGSSDCRGFMNDPNEKKE